MFFFRKFCALFLLVFFLSGLATAVLASGQSCTVSSLSADPPLALSANCSATEQCCCCKADSTCGAVGEKGTCFAKQMIVGRELVKDPADATKKIERLLSHPVTCSAVVCPLSTHTSVEEFIMEAVNYIFYLSIIMAPLMIIIGAAVFLTSAGNPKQTKLGTSIIQWTAIGFAIILFARGITAIIKMILVG